jgi:hypothetical protein
LVGCLVVSNITINNNRNPRRACAA